MPVQPDRPACGQQSILGSAPQSINSDKNTVSSPTTCCPCLPCWCLCRDVWSQFHANPLPDEPQRRQVLPDMSPRAVCTRMLGNLSNLGYHCWLQHGGGLLGAPILHSNLRLTAALIQLLPRYCKEVPPRLVTALLEQEQHCRSCLDHLYADLLRKGGFQVGLGSGWRDIS
jgi:hypothetical protein